MKIRLSHSFEDIISVNNLLLAWQEFLKGKRNKKDVQAFSFSLMDNILSLHKALKDKTYRHGGYRAFKISDPKPRNIHKANVRDRLVHHAICRMLYPFFERTFIPDSFSCRIDKGTHKAIKRFVNLNYKAGKNRTKTCFVLKCDIKKFFASIDHKTIKNVLREYVFDENILWLLEEVIDSFYSLKPGVGLPLGNLTSQLFVNIYMNKFDQFAKHRFKIKHYIRYADDFIILSQNKKWLEYIIPKIRVFLSNNLKLSLHPDKVFIKTICSGVDFLGWIIFPDHRIIRASSKRRIFKRIKENNYNTKSINSYFGLLKHGNTHNIKRDIVENLLKSVDKNRYNVV